MTAYFGSIGAPVFLYSTGPQWGQIAGSVPSTSPLAGLPSWLAGARSLSGAKRARPCPGSPAQQRGPDAICLRRADDDFPCFERAGCPRGAATRPAGGGWIAAQKYPGRRRR